MSNLTYNPNINDSYDYNSEMNMEFNDSNGNFKSYDNYDNYDNTPPLLQQMDPRADPGWKSDGQSMRKPMRQQMRQPIRQPIRQQSREQMRMPRPPSNYIEKPSKYKKQSNNYDETQIDKFEGQKSTKFNWILFGKKLIIYTALFLIMSHVKVDDLVCKFIPFLNENQILCMTFKGVILAIIIILVQTLLK